MYFTGGDVLQRARGLRALPQLCDVRQADDLFKAALIIETHDPRYLMVARSWAILTSSVELHDTTSRVMNRSTGWSVDSRSATTRIAMSRSVSVPTTFAPFGGIVCDAVQLGDERSKHGAQAGKRRPVGQ